MAWTEKKAKGWSGRYRDASGNIRTTGMAETKRAALKLAQDEEAKIRGDAWIDPQAGAMTLRQYFTEHWRPAKVGEINTLAWYDSMWNAAIEPTFGDLELRKILPSTVQRWIKQQQEAGVKASTIKARRVALQGIIAGKKAPSALLDRLIASNPCAATSLPTVVEREVEIFLPHEIDTLCGVLDPWWMPLIAVDIDLGIRWGELMGLQVNDFNLGFTEVKVRRTIVEASKARIGTGERFTVKQYPKGKRQRKLAISPDIAQCLAEIVAMRELSGKDRLFSMPDKTPPPEWQEGMELIWTPVRTEAWPGGKPISRSYFRVYVWLRALQQASLEHRRFHDLRASNISWMLSETKNMTMVMERAGHREFSTTKRYQAALEDASQEAVKALAKARKKDAKRQQATTVATPLFGNRGGGLTDRKVSGQ